MRPLILVGYRGTGKTSLGKRLARNLCVPFMDTDNIIVETAGKTVPEIFADAGEARFRDLEHAALQSAIRRAADGGVIATGGGIIVREENRSLLSGKGLVVWLKADPAVILERTGNDSNRPALTGLGPEEEIRSVLESRTPYYAEVSDHEIDTSSRPFTAIAEEIEDWYREVSG